MICFSFDRYFDIVTQKIFQNEKISRVKRVRSSDLILVGGEGNLYLLDLYKERFRMIRKFGSVMSGCITRIELFKSRVYLMDEEGEEIALLDLKVNIERMKYQ